MLYALNENDADIFRRLAQRERADSRNPSEALERQIWRGRLPPIRFGITDSHHNGATYNPDGTVASAGVGESFFFKLEWDGSGTVSVEDEPTHTLNCFPPPIPAGTHCVFVRDQTLAHPDRPDIGTKGYLAVPLRTAVSEPTPFLAGYLAGVYAPIGAPFRWNINSLNAQANPVLHADGQSRSRWFVFDHTFWYGQQFGEFLDPTTNAPFAIAAPIAGMYEISFHFGFELATDPVVGGVRSFEPDCELYVGRAPGVLGNYPLMTPLTGSDCRLKTRHIRAVSSVNFEDELAPSENFFVGGRAVVRVNTFLLAGDCVQLLLNATQLGSGTEQVLYDFSEVNLRVRFGSANEFGGG